MLKIKNNVGTRLRPWRTRSLYLLSWKCYQYWLINTNIIVKMYTIKIYHGVEKLSTLSPWAECDTRSSLKWIGSLHVRGLWIRIVQDPSALSLLGTPQAQSKDPRPPPHTQKWYNLGGCSCSEYEIIIPPFTHSLQIFFGSMKTWPSLASWEEDKNKFGSLCEIVLGPVKTLSPQKLTVEPRRKREKKVASLCKNK